MAEHTTDRPVPVDGGRCFICGQEAEVHKAKPHPARFVVCSGANGCGVYGASVASAARLTQLATDEQRELLRGAIRKANDAGMIHVFNGWPVADEHGLLERLRR